MTWAFRICDSSDALYDRKMRDLLVTTILFTGEFMRYECLDHLWVLSERHLVRMMEACIAYYSLCRPRQGLGQGNPPKISITPAPQGVRCKTILGGLHHHYSQVGPGDSPLLIHI